MLENAANHQPVKLAKDIKWLKIWDDARDRGQFWTGSVQSFYRLLITPVFGDRICWKCDSVIPPHVRALLTLPRNCSLNSLMSDLTSESELNTNILHNMKLFVFTYSHWYYFVSVLYSLHPLPLGLYSYILFSVNVPSGPMTTSNLRNANT